jgi:uncharacterized protein YgbK (DUF1537 family)
VTAVHVVADDLTGAAALAGELAGRGFVTVLSRDDVPVVDAEAVIIDTASRHLSEKDAARRVRAAVQARHGDEHTVTVKKIDSRFRGGFVGELRAFHEAHDGPFVVVAACPAAGCRTVDGHQVDDTRLDIDIPTLVEHAIGERPAVIRTADVRRGADHIAGILRAARSSASVVDGATDDDLCTAVSGAFAAGIRAVVGTYGLGQAIGRLLSGSTSVTALADIPPHSRAIVVVGSISSTARAQVRDLIDHGADEVAVAPAEMMSETAATAEATRVGAAVRASAVATVVVHTGTAMDDPRTAGPERTEAELTRRLAPVFASAVRARPEAAVILVGGETSGSVADYLRWTTLRIIGELAPGVAVGRAMDGAGRLVITKPGAFGNSSTLSDLVASVTGPVPATSPGRPAAPAR